MQQIVTFGILLIILGVFVTIAGVLLSILAEQGKDKTDVKGGAIIFIGPYP
jgi:uncharacterized membrane protein